MTTDKNYLKSFFKEYYFLIVPVIITLLLYSTSLSYGFRNFDEDVIIKNFYVKKTFGEYIEKYLLIDLSGITKASGFTFSAIKNIHFCILQRPLYYLVSYLFEAKPFLFHLLGLTLQLLVVILFTKFCYQLYSNKNVALFSGLLWSIHPTNIESIIWATNWATLAGAAIYFFTLYKIADSINKNSHIHKNMLFLLLATSTQILLNEYTISIPFAIFLTILFLTKDIKSTIKLSMPVFLISLFYLITRLIIVDKNLSSSSVNLLADTIQRIIFITPQTFLHELKLAIFPSMLTIDQIDLLNLDNKLFGGYHLFCIFIFFLFLFLIISFKNKMPAFSYGLLLYLIGIFPFLQIIPLYSLVAERYNYFGSAFLIFGIVSALHIWLSNKKKLLYLLLISLSITFGVKTFSRISDWKDSSSLFLSTINTSKSLLKKGVWTYNLALSQTDESKKKDLLNLSINLLDLFIQNNKHTAFNPPAKGPASTRRLGEAGEALASLDASRSGRQGRQPLVLVSYELDNSSLLAKAAYRISLIYDYLGNKEQEYKYLIRTLKFSKKRSQIRASVYKILGTYYFQKNDFQKAIEYYKNSFSISPSPELNFAIGVCYLKLNDLDNYGEYLKKSVGIISGESPNRFTAYAQYLELIKKDYENAAKYYKISTLLENSPQAYSLLANLYLKLGKFDNAMKYIKRGLYGFPHDETLLYLYKQIANIK